MIQVRVYRREVYGNTLYYFADGQSAIAQAIQKLTGKVCLSRANWKALEELGLAVVVVEPTHE